jgi:hypothetical protein
MRGIGSIVTVACVALVGIAGCGGSGASTTETPPPIPQEGVYWGVARVLGPRTMKIGTVSERCPGAPMPRIDRVKQVERGGVVYVTMLMDPPTTRRHRPCSGEELRIYTLLHLAHEVTHQVFYDTSTAPPARRWP